MNLVSSKFEDLKRQRKKLNRLFSLVLRACTPMIEAKLYLTNTLKKRHFSHSDIWHGLHGMHSKGTMPYFLKGLPSIQAETLRHSYNTRVVTEKRLTACRTTKSRYLHDIYLCYGASRFKIEWN